MTNINRKKEILFIVSSFMRGGMENMLINVANIVAEQHNVTIYNLGNHDEKMVERLRDGVHYNALWMPCKNALKGIKYGDVNNNGTKRYTRVLPASIWYKIHSSEYIHKRMVQEHFDVEVAFFVGEPIKIIAGAPKNTKKIMWIHNDYAMCSGLFDCFSSKKKAIAGFCKYDSAICVSKQAEQSYVELTGLKNTTVVYNYLNVEEIIRKSKLVAIPKKSSFSIVSVGRLVQAKGFDRLLKATKKLQDEGYTFDITIVGDGAERENLESMIQSENLKNIHLVGMQENPYPYIANADLLVCASRYEGYNLTVAESLILGIPVLSTACTGPTEILDDGKYGMLVENSEDEVYFGLKEFLKDRSILEKYQNLAEQRLEFFNEEKRKKEILDLFA